MDHTFDGSALGLVAMIALLVGYLVGRLRGAFEAAPPAYPQFAAPPRELVPTRAPALRRSRAALHFSRRHLASIIRTMRPRGAAARVDRPAPDAR